MLSYTIEKPGSIITCKHDVAQWHKGKGSQNRLGATLLNPPSSCFLLDPGRDKGQGRKARIEKKGTRAGEMRKGKVKKERKSIGQTRKGKK